MIKDEYLYILSLIPLGAIFLYFKFKLKGYEIIDFNIKPTVDALCATYELAAGKLLADYHKGNVKARIRMTVQYAVVEKAYKIPKTKCSKRTIPLNQQAIEAIQVLMAHTEKRSATLLLIDTKDRSKPRKVALHLLALNTRTTACFAMFS